MDPRLMMAVIVVLGVPAVLVGYIVLTEKFLRVFPSASSRVSGPGCGCAGLTSCSCSWSPDDRDDPWSFQDKAGGAFVGLDNYAWFFRTADTLGARGTTSSGSCS